MTERPASKLFASAAWVDDAARALPVEMLAPKTGAPVAAWQRRLSTAGERGFYLGIFTLYLAVGIDSASAALLASSRLPASAVLAVVSPWTVPLGGFALAVIVLGAWAHLPRHHLITYAIASVPLGALLFPVAVIWVARAITEYIAAAVGTAGPLGQAFGFAWLFILLFLLAWAPVAFVCHLTDSEPLPDPPRADVGPRHKILD